jgi:hypothetical protein
MRGSICSISAQINIHAAYLVPLCVIRSVGDLLVRSANRDAAAAAAAAAAVTTRAAAAEAAVRR